MSRDLEAAREALALLEHLRESLGADEAMLRVLQYYATDHVGHVARRPAKEQVTRAVAELHEMTADEFLSGATRRHVRARREAIVLMMDLCRMSGVQALAELGSTNRAEATRAREAVDADPSMSAEVAALVDIIESECGTQPEVQAPSLTVLEGGLSR